MIGKRRSILISLVACALSNALVPQAVGEQRHPWGSLANPGREGERLKTTYFFAGDWRFPDLAQFYEYRPASNHCLYTVSPVDPRHLGWSESAKNRSFALAQMRSSGVNVVTMSYWGQPGTDRWAFWAPMQTSTTAHDELFDAAAADDLFITPAIESGAATRGMQQTGCAGDLGPVGTSDAYVFADDFPGTSQDPAPRLVAQIEDLVDRYLLHPQKKKWKSRWTQLHDRNGDPRYAVHIIHAASNQLCPARVACAPVDDEMFAAGFRRVADKVQANTGVRIGFLIDALPEETRFAFNYTPSAPSAGVFLAREPAILGIQAFIPEVFFPVCGPDAACDDPEGSPELTLLIERKRAFIAAWVATGIPTVLDVSSGYDAHRVFPSSPRYGNNQPWRDAQQEMIDLGVIGLAFNAWNGYTEGLAAVPVCALASGPPALPPCPTADGADAAYRWWSNLTPAQS